MKQYLISITTHNAASIMILPRMTDSIRKLAFLAICWVMKRILKSSN